MDRYDDIFAALAAPFTKDEVKSRQQRTQTFRYVKPRTIENRLDNVLGCGNWEDDTWPANDGTGAYICHLTITLPGGEKVTKVGVGGPGGEGSQAHPAKTAASDALKRAAEKFGIARYLYGEGVADHRQQQTPTPQQRQAPAQEGPRTPDNLTKAEKLIGWANSRGHYAKLRALADVNYSKDPAALNDEQAQALYKVLEAGTRQSAPANGNGAPAPTAPPQQRSSNGSRNENGAPVDFGWPRSGAALFAWAKNLEQAFQIAIVRSIDAEFGEKSQRGWPRSYKEWTPQQVEQAAVYVAGELKAKCEDYNGQFDSKIPDVEGLKLEMGLAAKELCQKVHGHSNPSFGQIAQVITMHSAEISDQFGGECFDDFEKCQDATLLKGCLAALKQDLAESAGFAAGVL